MSTSALSEAKNILEKLLASKEKEIERLKYQDVILRDDWQRTDAYHPPQVELWPEGGNARGLAARKIVERRRMDGKREIAWGDALNMADDERRKQVTRPAAPSGVWNGHDPWTVPEDLKRFNEQQAVLEKVAEKARMRVEKYRAEGKPVQFFDVLNEVRKEHGLAVYQKSEV